MTQKPWPAEKIERRKTDSLVPYARNARTHSDHQVGQIAKSIETYGFTIPVLIDDKGEIIAGHGRVMAAKALGLDEVPCMIARGWSEQQKRAYVIADNQIALQAGWDNGLLADELRQLGQAGWDLELTGFTQDEMDALFASEDAVRKGKKDPDDVPAPEADTVTRVGQVWALGRHRLVVGDCTDEDDVDALMGDDQADLVWTDPPYNVAIEGAAGTIMNDDMTADAFAEFLDAVYASYFRVMREGACIYVAHADSERSVFTGTFERAGFHFAQVRIWVKNAAVLSRQDFNWQHEPILYGWKPGGPHYFSGDFSLTTVVEDDLDIDKLSKADLRDIVRKLLAERPSTVIRQDRPTRSALHPTMKPVALVTEMIEASSREGEIVADFFGGSGTTLIAAEMTARTARIMELDPKYADVIIRRWQEFTGREAFLADQHGATFASFETSETEQEPA